MIRSLVFFTCLSLSIASATPLRLVRDGHWLVILGDKIPGKEIRINYLEAYCRTGSTEVDWVKHTVIPHRSEFLSMSGDGRTLQLRDTLADGVIVSHTISTEEDEVNFNLTVHNPTDRTSEVHWAQPCVRLSRFTGFNEKAASNATDYLRKCFVFLDGKLSRMPFEPWATKARYTPGQVWCPIGIPRTDVNPRPLSPLIPSCGLIGCYSGDEKVIFATAWEPYQELFQGVARCLHSDFRLGGLAPGETKRIRGRIYIVDNDKEALMARYKEDFPEHFR